MSDQHPPPGEDAGYPREPWRDRGSSPYDGAERERDTEAGRPAGPGQPFPAAREQPQEPWQSQQYPPPEQQGGPYAEGYHQGYGGMDPRYQQAGESPPQHPQGTPHYPYGDDPRYGQPYGQPQPHGEPGQTYGEPGQYGEPAWGQPAPAPGQPGWSQYGQQSPQPGWAEYGMQPLPAMPGTARWATTLLFVLNGVFVLTDIIAALTGSGTFRGLPSGVSSAERAGAVLGVLFVAFILGGLFLWLTIMTRKGRAWARITSTVLLGIGIIFSLSGLAGGGPVALLYLVQLLIEIAVLVTLWLRPSREYFDALARSARG